MLRPLVPFSEGIFVEEVHPFADWLCERVERQPLAGRRGWGQQLVAYEWRGDDWRAGVARRETLGALLRKAEQSHAFLTAVDEVMGWGQMGQLTRAEADRVRDSLNLLDRLEHGGEAWSEVFAERIAAVSKLYEFARPNSWTIYDSRVASCLAFLVNEWWHAEGSERLDHLLRFPWPAGRDSRPQPGFPRLSGRSGQQAVLGFFYASWLLRHVAVLLNRAGATVPDGGQWTLMHVEMVAFTLGGALRADPGAAESKRREHEEGGVTMAGAAGAGAGKAAAAAGVAMKAAEKGLEKGRDVVADQAIPQGQEQLERMRAKQRAVKYAEQTGGQLGQVQFHDGRERWVVFKDLRPIAAFPPYEGDLADALSEHDRVKLRGPRAVRATLPGEKARKRVQRIGKAFGRALPRRRSEEQAALPEGAEEADAAD